MDIFFTVLTAATVFVLALPLLYLVGHVLGLPVRGLQSGLMRASRAIDAANDGIGRFVAWFALAMVLIQTVVVLQRYVFGVNFIWLQESVMYLHGFLFLLASGYTLLHNGHVRVDVFYREAGVLPRAIIDFAGCYVFLFPVMLVVLEVTYPYVRISWIVSEGSAETSGIPGIYLLKTVILGFAALLLAQGLSMAIKQAFILTGVVKDAGKEEHLTF